MKVFLLISLVSLSLATQAQAAASCDQLNHDADDLNRVINNKSSGCLQGSQRGSVNDTYPVCHSLKARNNALADICSKMKCEICPSFYNDNAVASYPKGDFGGANPIASPSCGGDGQPACSTCGGNGQPACSSADWGVANPIANPSCGGDGQPACSTCGGNGQPACSSADWGVASPVAYPKGNWGVANPVVYPSNK